MGAIIHDDAVIVGGCGRSGTTLLRLMLDAHAQLAIGPESKLLLEEGPLVPDDQLAFRFDLPVDVVVTWRAEASTHLAFVVRFFREFARRRTAARWGEKTPRNVHRVAWILEHLPAATFVHVIRDPFDTVCSLRTHPRHRVANGELVQTGILNPLDECVGRWVKDVAAGMAHRDHPRYTEVRYEQLVTDPRAVMGDLLERLDLPWSDQVMAHHEFTAPTRDPVRFPQNPEATQPVNAAALGRASEELDDDEWRYVADRTRDLRRILGYGDRRSTDATGRRAGRSDAEPPR